MVESEALSYAVRHVSNKPYSDRWRNTVSSKDVKVGFECDGALGETSRELSESFLTHVKMLSYLQTRGPNFRSLNMHKQLTQGLSCYRMCSIRVPKLTDIVNADFLVQYSLGIWKLIFGVTSNWKMCED